MTDNPDVPPIETRLHKIDIADDGYCHRCRRKPCYEAELESLRATTSRQAERIAELEGALRDLDSKHRFCKLAAGLEGHNLHSDEPTIESFMACRAEQCRVNSAALLPHPFLSQSHEAAERCGTCNGSGRVRVGTRSTFNAIVCPDCTQKEDVK